jgi:hypothetical protein
MEQFNIMNRTLAVILGKPSRSDTFVAIRFPSYSRWKHIAALLVFIGLLAVGRAESWSFFNYAETNGSVTITKYTGIYGSVDVPETIMGKPVTSIADAAFSSNATLTNISIPTNVVTIGQAAFNGCVSLKTITVAPDNWAYTSIDGALYLKNQTFLVKCPEGWVGSFTIPQFVYNIGEFAFVGCRGLTAIMVAPGNPAYASIDGVLLSKNLTLLFVCPAGKTGSYAITNKVTQILQSAFSGCAGLTSITIPNSVTAITSNAFHACSGLTHITLPGSITDIENSAFAGCTGLTNVTIPKTVNMLEDGVFAGCTRLKSLHFEGDAPQYPGINPLFDANSQGTVYYREGATGWGHDFRGWRTALWFDAEVHDFTYLQNGSVITITGYTGSGGDVTIPATIFGEAVTTIGDAAFSGHTNLTSVTMPYTLTSISASAFFGCSSLTRITIPYTVTSIGELAFADCPGLTNAYFEGNSPALPGPGQLFENSQEVTVFYHPGNAGWNIAFQGRPTKLWTDPVAADFKFQPIGSAFSIVGYKGSNGAVVIPDVIYGMPVTSIGNSAFNSYGYDNRLTNVTVSINVTNIGASAFLGCISLSNVTILGNINTIGSSAFNGCKRLQGVYFAGDAPAAFDEDYTFFNSTNVTVYYRPGTKGWGPTFAGRPTAPWIDPDARDFTYLQNGLEMTLTGYWGSGGVINLPETIFGKPVTAIGDSGFSYADTLTSVTMPGSIKRIGFAAFYACAGLQSVAIGNGVTNIDQLAFADCPALTNVTFGVSVVEIGDSAFRGDASLPRILIPGNITKIGNWAFAECASLTNINIPNSVTSLGGGVFEGCAGLTDVTIPNAITSIEDATFANCAKLTNIAIPNSVTHIGNAAFASCSSLTSILIPGSVTNLGFGIFANCTGLTGVYFAGNAPAVPASYDMFENAANVTVYYRAGTTGWEPTFAGRPTALWIQSSSDFTYTITNETVTITRYNGPGGSVTIPDAIMGMPVTSIGSYAFTTTIATSVTIPSSVTSIGEHAFDSSSVSGITIGNNVNNIGNYAFASCIQLTSITIPNSVTNIGSYAFSSCIRMTSVAIGNSVARIGDFAFYNCKLNSVAIPGSVTNIGNSTFNYCSSLTNITIPNSVTSIGAGAFSSCLFLPAIIIPDSVTSLSSSVFSNCTSLANVAIGNRVTGIGNDAFYKCANLAGLVIPNSVTSIGDEAFYQCTRLTGITMSDNVTNIGKSAFYGCKSLTNITIPDGVERILDGAFSGCTALTSVAMPDSVKFLGKSMFAGCTSLTGVTLGNGITNIGDFSFSNCNHLLSLTIPNGVASLGTGAFTNCSALANVSIPNSVTNIGVGTFSKCLSLTNIIIPAGVTRIGARAFDGSTNLLGVYFEGDAPAPVPPYLFTNANFVTVYYIAGTKGWGFTYADRLTRLWIQKPSYDEWAIIMGLMDLVPAESGELDDPDHDGMDNLAEMEAGTDPLDPQSVLKFESLPRLSDLVYADRLAMEPGQHALYFQTVPGKQYLIQSVNAFGDEWQNVTNIIATTTQKRVLVNKPVDQAFYRVVLVP